MSKPVLVFTTICFKTDQNIAIDICAPNIRGFDYWGTAKWWKFWRIRVKHNFNPIT